MKREEIISKIKGARSAEELAEAARNSGISGITEETAGRLYNRMNSDHELSDEELDVSAAGCFMFDTVICPVCQKSEGFEMVSLDVETQTYRLKCDSCQNIITVSASDI